MIIVRIYGIYGNDWGDMEQICGLKMGWSGRQQKKDKEKNVLLLRCRLAAQVSERKVYSNRRG